MDIDVTRIRADFPALKNYIWMQNGGVSITPTPVAQEHAERMRELYERGPMHIVYPDEEYARRRQSMKTLADFFSCSEEELALMRGVSEAFQTVLRGLEWKVGDRIVVSDDEEAAVLLPLLHLRDVSGIELIRVPIVDDADEQVAIFERHFDARTRLIALSHVTTDRGSRLPVERLCAAARVRGILSFVDMAHSAGLWPQSLPDIGCDFAGLLSYKWMYAPYAAGLLYVHRERLDALHVRYAGGRSQESLDFERGVYRMRTSAERFQYGPWSWPLVHAWARSVEYLSAIDTSAIWKRTEHLTQLLKDALLGLGADLYTPLAGERSAALVSFGLCGIKGKTLSEELERRWNIVIKALPHGPEGLRASMTFFLLEEEIDVLVEGLHSLVREKGSE